MSPENKGITIWSIVKLLVSFQNVVSLEDLLSENDFNPQLQGFI